MGAGDALLSGTLAALISGAPLIKPSSQAHESVRRTLESAVEFGILLASFSLTSPHTIHPDANLENLLDFADSVGVTFNESLDQLVIQSTRRKPN